MEQPGASISLKELAKFTDISISDVSQALPYLKQSFIFSSYTSNFEEVIDSLFTPAEKILKFKKFQDVIDSIIATPFPRQELSLLKSDAVEVHEYLNHQYIHQDRIINLKALKSVEFDFIRLNTICEEINCCAKNKNYFALGALIRILLDHIPPIFGCRDFNEVANNYKTGKSVKKSLKNLQDTSRNISDGLLHQVIRRTESLPNLNQVNFSAEIDVLLGEIVRIIMGKNIHIE